MACMLDKAKEQQELWTHEQFIISSQRPEAPGVESPIWALLPKARHVWAQQSICETVKGRGIILDGSSCHEQNTKQSGQNQMMPIVLHNKKFGAE